MILRLAEQYIFTCGFFTFVLLTESKGFNGIYQCGCRLEPVLPSPSVPNIDNPSLKPVFKLIILGYNMAESRAHAKGNKSTTLFYFQVITH